VVRSVLEIADAGMLTPIILEQYHIYMADNSRISIAGLNDGNVEYVGQCIAECLKQEC
jgi:aspartate/tyrosine/aromatic aminotransferase